MKNKKQITEMSNNKVEYTTGEYKYRYGISFKILFPKRSYQVNLKGYESTLETNSRLTKESQIEHAMVTVCENIEDNYKLESDNDNYEHYSPEDFRYRDYWFDGMLILMVYDRFDYRCIELKMLIVQKIEKI